MSEAGEKPRILVTGATGLLGKFVVRELKTQGYDVAETSKSLGYDLRNESEALTSMWLARPGIVVHLARSAANTPDTPASAYRDTLFMDTNVLQGAALSRAKIVTVLPPMLVSPMSMLSGEAQAKSAFCDLARHYSTQYGIEARTLLFSELYGPFMRPQEGFLDVLTLINTFLLSRLKNESHVVLPGTGEAKRQLLCVTDAAKAVVKACEKPTDGALVNFPGSDTMSEKDLVDLVVKACEYGGQVEWDGQDSSPLRPPVLEKGTGESVLGLKPQMRLEHGLATMVAMRLEGAGLKKEEPSP